MDYCTLEEVRTELVKQGASAVDDNAIVERIPRACAELDRLCKYPPRAGWRAFDDQLVTDEIRRGAQVKSADDGALLVTVAKGYCQSVSGAACSSDLKTWHTLPLDQLDISNYDLTFLNVFAPRSGRLFAKLSYRGGFAVLPDDLIQCAVRITAFLYHKREAPFEVTAFPDVGQIVVPSAVPSDVIQALSAFKRVTP